MVFRRSVTRIALGLALVWGGTACPAGVASAAGVSPASATAVQREQAQARFARGKDHFAAKRYDEALSEFAGSFEIVASPNARLYSARCLRELGRFVEAYAEFGRANVEARESTRDDARYEKTAQSAMEEREEVAYKLGFINVTVEHAAPSTTLRVASSAISRGGWSEPLPVAPGATEIVLETPGHSAQKQTLVVSAGEKKSLTLDAHADGPIAPEAPPAPPSATSHAGLRPFAYGAGAVGAAGLLTFAIAGAMSSSTYDDLKAQCNGPCPPGHEDAISRGKTQQAVANVGLAFGIAGALAGVTLYVISMSPGRSRAAVVAAPSSLELRASF